MVAVPPVLRVDEELLRLDWPMLAPTAGIRLRESDRLVLCAGFEARAVAVLDSVCVRGSRSSAVVVEYEPAYEDNKREAIAKMCREAGVEAGWVVYDRRSPRGAGETVARRLAGATRVYIDISAMSRMLAVQVIVALARRECGLAGVHVLYTEAGSYPPTKEEVEGGTARQGMVNSYISSGVWELAAIPELSAPAALNEAMRLVAFPSFNPAQLELLFQELQPTFVDLISGVPPRGENAWRPEAIRRLNAKAVGGLRGVGHYSASTLDYRETLRLLLRIYDERVAFDRIVISPSGSKMQSVAVALARSFLRDIQIVYPTPQIFLEPRRHTLGAKQIYELDLGTFAGIGQERHRQGDE